MKFITYEQVMRVVVCNLIAEFEKLYSVQYTHSFH